MTMISFRPATVSAALLMLGLGFSSPLTAADAPAPLVAGPAPAWHLKDLDGNEVRSEDFKGKVVVIDFWAVWCAPCKTEIPGYVDLQKKYGADGLVVLGVIYDQEKPETVKKFVDKYGVAYRVLLGTDEMESAFGSLEAIPTTFLIDRDGVIRDRKMGAVPTQEYEKRILRYLKPAETKA